MLDRDSAIRESQVPPIRATSSFFSFFFFQSALMFSTPSSSKIRPLRTEREREKETTQPPLSSSSSLSLSSNTHRKKKQTRTRTDRLPARPAPAPAPPQDLHGRPALPEAAEEGERAGPEVGQARRQAAEELLRGPGGRSVRSGEQGGAEAQGRQRQQEHQGER